MTLFVDPQEQDTLLCGKKINNIVNILLTLLWYMELAETETKADIKSATAVEHFPRAVQREWYYLNSSNRLPNNEP